MTVFRCPGCDRLGALPLDGAHPCPWCALAGAGKQSRLCPLCGEHFFEEHRSGKPRKYCPTCRPVPLSLGVCIFCGDVFMYPTREGIRSACPAACTYPRKNL